MDGKHNQQFWLRSTISQYSIWFLGVPSFLCSSGIGVCAAGQMRLQCALQLRCLSHEGLGELLECTAGPFHYFVLSEKTGWFACIVFLGVAEM